MFFELLHLLIVALISLFGIHRIILLIEARSYSKQPLPPLVVDGERLPRVLIQIPVYCDAKAALRCLKSLHHLDWPSRQLEIQVLDDSDDDSDQLIAAGVAESRRLGFDILHLQRRERTGFKAGALAAGLLHSSAQFVAVFDADFTVPFDFLRRTIGAFDRSNVGMVQTRWGHRNRDFSLLTRAQARLLDGHFRLEHRARSAAGRFFNFNGTAGIWRRSTIDDCGGWSGDTVVEDMELSLRAWRRGWKFCYLDDIVCPADLPDNFGALRTQQRRWVAGGMQVLSSSFGDSQEPSSKPGWFEQLDLLAILGGSLVAPLLLLLSFLLPCLWWQR
ncbi:MAG: glycosyltransferase family 2 protein, partial [Planctomycetota bacterium]